MNQIVPIDLGQVPAHIAQGRRLDLNAAAHANVQAGFAVIGYKGRVWSLRYRGETTQLAASPGVGHDGRPLPVTPVPSLDVVVCGVSRAISKSFYLKGFSEGDQEAPDCFSTNGVAPDPTVKHKQCTSCAACEQNRFGSRMTEGGKKAKACSDHRRLAVVPAGDEANETFGGPMLLRIPPMSLLNLDSYATALGRMGADVSDVVTRIGFNYDVAYPEITFQAIGWVGPDPRSIVLEHADSDLVRRMLDEAYIESAPATAPVDASVAALAGQERPAPLPAEAAPQPVQAAPEPAPAPAPQPVVSPFQAAAPQPVQAAPQPAPQPTPQPAATAPKASPFQQAAVKATPAPQPTPQTAAATSQAVAPTVVQGAPADMESMIDGLLQR